MSKFGTKEYRAQERLWLNRSERGFAGSYQPYGHIAGSLGYFAHKMHMRPISLIAAFSSAGISGLTPNHKIESSQWNSFFEFYGFLKKSEANELYIDNSNIEKKIVIVQEINTQLLKDLARNPDLIYGIPPRTFEELIAKLLEDQGCEVVLSKNTRDGGYDILGKTKAGPSDLVFLVECKPALAG